jgi:hypothetical protein
MSSPTRAKIRCAVYTRKSSEEGLEAQNAGERREFGSQTATRLNNPRELRGLLSTRKPPRFGFEPEIRFSVLPSTQSETPVPPKIHFETNPLRLREKHTLVSLPYRLFATP